MKYPLFFRALVTGVIAPVFGIALSNYLVDPYGVLQAPRIKNFNSSKPLQNRHQRLLKAIKIIEIKPKSIILGTSRAQRYPEEHVIFEDFQPAYNSALAGSSIYEIKRYIEHAVVNQPDLSYIIIGIDFFSFGSGIRTSPGFSESRLELRRMSFNDLRNILFSLDAASDSLETVTKNFNISHSKKISETQVEKSPFQETSSKEKFEIVLESYFDRSDRYYEFKLSESHLNDLSDIAALCNEYGIKLELIIPPVHASQIEAIYVAGLWSDFENWKREVVKIHPAWDFSGYNSITTEAIDDEMIGYSDSSHFTPKVAQQILDFVMSPMSHDEELGTLISSSNIDVHLEKIRRDREQWQRNNPNYSQWIRSIYKSSQTGS